VPGLPLRLLISMATFTTVVAWLEETDRELGIEHYSAEFALGNLNAANPEQSWASVLCTFQCPWWTRLWTVQDISLLAIYRGFTVQGSDTLGESKFKTNP
jgi:hypothetical protein